MAALCKFPCFLSLPSHKFFFNQHQHEQDCQLSWRTIAHELRPRKQLTICACSVKKSRGSRKVKSNAELCNDIREFISAVGLPEDHVPSMKELSDHGRSDLANIVRRRGYKLIKELLANSTLADIKDFNGKYSLNGGEDIVSDPACIATGQGVRAEDMAVENVSSTEDLVTSNQSSSSFTDQDPSLSVHSYISVEPAVNSTFEQKMLYSVKRQDNEANSTVEDSSFSASSYNMDIEEHGDDAEDNYIVEQPNREVLSLVQDPEVSMEDNHQASLSISSHFKADNSTHMPLETIADSSFKENAPSNSKGQDEGIDNMFPNNVMISSVESKKSIDHIHIPTNSTTSLEEKVANFIQNGQLDVIEDNVYGILHESSSDESGGCQHANGRREAAFTSDGSISTSNQITPSVTDGHVIKNDQLMAESVTGANPDKDFDVETNKNENQVEINHLKYMLHQKELELSQLKEQIEKEQLALSALQAKTEMEINRAQKLVSKKDAELHAAEETLSGLVEVKIQYSGEGEIVEVAGSFNGWHHRIKMDPQPSSSFTEPVGSRKCRLWSKMLWLYPGVYEIKFVVDGRWKIDSQKESVSTGGICNNILRVY